MDSENREREEVKVWQSDMYKVRERERERIGQRSIEQRGMHEKLLWRSKQIYFELFVSINITTFPLILFLILHLLQFLIPFPYLFLFLLLF